MEVSVAVLIFSSLICFLVPISSSICLFKKDKNTMKPIIVGVFVFFLFQIALKVPLSALVMNSYFYEDIANNVWLDSIIMGLLYGVFGELGKLFGFKSFLRNHNKWIDGIALGVGYGGMGAIYSVGLDELEDSVLLTLTSIKGYDYTEILIGSEKLDLLLDQFQYLKNIDLFVESFNQVLFMIIQVALSVLVLYAVNNGKYIYVFVAVIFDLLIYIVDFTFFAEFDWSIFSINSVLLIFAGVSMIFIVKLKELFLFKG